MKRSSTSTATLVVGSFGAIFALVFLALNDPDAMAPGALSASKWAVLLPAAFLFAAWPSARAWVTGLVLAAGVFAGTCVAAMFNGSNVWPIAGVYWTVVWSPPIVVGSAAGAVAAWVIRARMAR